MRKILVLFLPLLLLPGCKSGDRLNHKMAQDALPAVDEATKALTQGSGAQVVSGINQLGFNLLQPLSQLNRQANVCISPTSIAIALGIARTGAVGPTKVGIAKACGSDGIPDGDLDNAARNLMSVLSGADPKVDVRLANSLWVASSINLESAYQERTSRSFRAEVAQADFASPAAVKQINGWVSDATAGHIPAMLDGPKPGTSLLILNAVYFKGSWSTPFDKKATEDGDFHFAGGSTHAKPMMHRTGSFRYAKTGHGQLLSIPYASARFAMLIYLPDEGAQLSDAITGLQAGTWSNNIGKMAPAVVDVTMPKFSVNFKASLRWHLIALGMDIACSPGVANFSGISHSPLFISEVLHRTTTDVDEEGTVATAATSIEMRATSAGPGTASPPPIQFIANRPFLYAIRDTVTGAILFLGLLYDPQQ